MLRGCREVLLRVANVNPSATGVLVLLYSVYLTLGVAAFIDAAANHTHPWYRWLIGPVLAAWVFAYDSAALRRVAIGHDTLDPGEPEQLRKRPTIGRYAR